MTLVEVLVVLSLMALVVAGLLPLLTAGQQSWDHGHRRQEMVQNARIALDSLTHSMRAAQTFSVISSTNIRFSYFFGDNASTPMIEYQLNGATNELEYRWDPSPFHPLAGPFRSMSVQCFSASGASIACGSVSAVRAVEFSLVAMDPQGIVSDITVTSRVFRQVP